MSEIDFEGTLVLEQLAEHDLLDDFYEAIDSDDIETVIKIMREAKIDSTTIGIVVETIKDFQGNL